MEGARERRAPTRIAAALAQANIITNGSFETNALAGTTALLGSGNTASLPGWQVTGSCGGNCILILTSGYTEPQSGYGTITFQAQAGNQAIDITGSSNSLTGGLSQAVTTTAGNSYTLSFYVGNMDDGATSYTLPSSVQLLINGTSQGVFSNDNNTSHQVNWALQSVNFTASGASTTVAFVNATPVGDNYAGLDNVDLELNPTPEPASGLLVGAIGVGLILRKRFRAGA